MKRTLCIALTLLLALLSALPALAEAPTPPKPVAAESEKAFLGRWEPSGVYARGAMMGPERFPLDLVLDASHGKMLLTSNGQTFVSATQFQSDGTLLVVDDTGSTLIFNLNDDGTISCMQNVQGDVIVLYFAHPAAQQSDDQRSARS